VAHTPIGAKLLTRALEIARVTGIASAARVVRPTGLTIVLSGLRKLVPPRSRQGDHASERENFGCVLVSTRLTADDATDISANASVVLASESALETSVTTR